MMFNCQDPYSVKFFRQKWSGFRQQFYHLKRLFRDKNNHISRKKCKFSFPDTFSFQTSEMIWRFGTNASYKGSTNYLFRLVTETQLYNQVINGFPQKMSSLILHITFIIQTQGFIIDTSTSYLPPSGWKIMELRGARSWNIQTRL